MHCLVPATCRRRYVRKFPDSAPESRQKLCVVVYTFV